MHSRVALVLAIGSALLQGPGSPPPPTRIGEHTGAVTHLALSSDGKVLFSAARDLEIHAWDLKKARVLWMAPIDPPAPEIADLAAGKDAVAWTGGIAHATFLDQESGEKLERMGGVAASQHPALCMAADPEGRWVWIGTSNQLARVTPGNPSTGWGLRAWPCPTRCLAADESGQLLAIGGEDGTIRFLNPTSSQRVEELAFEGHPGPVTALAFDPKGKVLVAGCSDGSVRQWDMKRGEATPFQAGHAAAVAGIAFDPKGKRLASVDVGGALRVWDAKTLEEGAALVVAAAPVLDLVFLDERRLAVPDGERVALFDLGKP